MHKKFAIGVAIYVIFFAAIALSSAGAQTASIALVLLSAGAAFWLGFSVYRITQWIRHRGRLPTRREAAIANYPHWFAHFAFDEDEPPEKGRPTGLIDTV